MLEKILKIIDALNSQNVEYTIIGGFAVILHGFLRATEDIDIIVNMNDNNIKKLRKALKSIYDDMDIEEINYGELRKYAVIRYGTPDNFYIDLIGNIGEMFSYSNIESEKKEIDGITINIATVKSLYEMKKNTLREKDQLDIKFLSDKLNKDDKKV